MAYNHVNVNNQIGTFSLTTKYPPQKQLFTTLHLSINATLSIPWSEVIFPELATEEAS